MKKVLVTGANGQLGNCIKEAAKEFSEIDFRFVDKNALNITNATQVATFFEHHSFDFCINTAAYTQVEKAESDPENAFLVNAEGVKNLAEACYKHHIILLHISTDYVFDGNKSTPYVETDKTNPINVYGASKLKGEEYIQETCKKYFIIRTSWLYSQFGHNFFKSILKLAKEKDTLTITTDQRGSPTNANDLANFLLTIITSETSSYGVYHFSNKGNATWFDFAEEIVSSSKDLKLVKIVKTDNYPTFAKRPKYSVLSIEKLQKTFHYNISEWRESLRNSINNI